MYIYEFFLFNTIKIFKKRTKYVNYHHFFYINLIYIEQKTFGAKNIFFIIFFFQSLTFRAQINHSLSFENYFFSRL